MSKGTLTLSILGEVVGGAEGKEDHGFFTDNSGGSPSSGGGSSDWGSNQSSWHSTIMRVSEESN